MEKMLLDRRCESFGSSDRTGVGGCGSVYVRKKKKKKKIFNWLKQYNIQLYT